MSEEKEEIDSWCTDEVVCPHCGFEYSDSWEFHLNNDNQQEIECCECQKSFYMIPEFSVHYSTYKMEIDQ